jgi:sugar phosphate permease
VKKIFFGWYIVAAALVLMTYNSAMFAYGFTAFLTPITATFGWSYAQVSFASSLRGLETGALDPFVGVAADRWSARKLMFIGIIILSLGIICVSQSTSLAMFYGGFLILGLGSAIGVSMVPMTVIARWFKKNIGKASGIQATGVAIGGLFTPLLVSGIDAYGWQDFMVYLALGGLAVGLALTFLFRNRPEDYGLLPDGKIQGGTEDESSSDFGMEAKKALRTRAFWYIGIATMLQMMAMHALTLHMMPYLTSLGMERSRAAVAVTIFSVVTIAGRILYGISADIFSKKYVIAFSMLLTAVGLTIFHLLDGSSFAMVVIFAVVYGIGAAGAMPLRTPIVREYFGVKRFGTIYGLMGLFLTSGVAIGAPLAGWVYDTRGVYDPIWLIFACLTAVGMVLILIMEPPRSMLSPVAES